MFSEASPGSPSPAAPLVSAYRLDPAQGDKPRTVNNGCPISAQGGPGPHAEQSLLGVGGAVGIAPGSRPDSATCWPGDLGRAALLHFPHL